MADPLLGAVASTVVGSGLNALSADAQRRHDYARLQESREYNSPKNQVKRLREAGINPALALTNGMISSGTMDQTAGGQSAPTFDFSPIAQGVRSSVELSQQKALQDSQIRNQDSNTIAQNQRNLFGLQNAYIDTLRNIQELKKLGADTNFLEKRADLMQKEIDAFDQRNSEEVARIRSERIKLDEEAASVRLSNAYQEIVNQFAPAQQKQILSNLQATERQLLSAAASNNAQAAHSIALEALTKAQKQGADIDNDVKDRIADALVDKAYQEADLMYYNSGSAAKQYFGGRVGHELPLQGFSDSEKYNRRVQGRQRPAHIPNSKR